MGLFEALSTPSPYDMSKSMSDVRVQGLVSHGLCSLEVHD